MRTLAILLLLVGILVPRTRGQDPLDQQLGLGRDAGSMPLWTRSNESDRSSLRQAYKALNKSVLIVGNPGGHGTAFVISRKNRLIATNAHVADIVDAKNQSFAMANHSNVSIRIERRWYHPNTLRIRGGQEIIRSSNPADGDVYPICPDVAVLQLADDGTELPDEVILSGREEYRDLVARPIGMVGYPGYNSSFPADGKPPIATMQDGIVNRMTDFSGDASAATGRLQFVQHSAPSFGGFSGSPIFLPNGQVVAINNSSRYVPDRKKSEGAPSDIFQIIPHAVRIDCLWELLDFHGLGDKVAGANPLLQGDETGRGDDVNKLREAATLVREAERLSWEKDYNSAGNKCNQALQIAPKYARAFNVRAVIFQRYGAENARTLGKAAQIRVFQDALDDAKTYLQLAPADPQSSINYALALVNSGMSRDDRNASSIARQILDKILTVEGLRNADRGHALAYRAMARFQIKDVEGALGDFRDAIPLIPDSPIPYENRAKIWRSQGKLDLEAKDLGEARERVKGRQEQYKSR